MGTVHELFQPSYSGSGSPVERLLLILLVAFIVGQLNAWCYKWTHRGLSYSRTFTQALVLITIIAALSMSFVAAKPIVALGLIGGLAIIRFRTVVRDARDTAYIFLSLICGMACGFGFHGAAVIGAVAVNAVAIYLHATGFGAWHVSDSLLRFQIDASSLDSTALDPVLSRFCRRYALVTVDESDLPGADGASICQCAYRVSLRDPEQAPDLISAMRESFRVSAIHLLVEQEHEEVA